MFPPPTTLDQVTYHHKQQPYRAPAKPKPKVNAAGVIGLSVVAVVLGCCGLGAISAIFDDGPDTSKPAASASRETLRDPVTAASPTLEVAPASTASPSPTPTRSIKPSPRPTRSSPAPRRTTSAPRTTTKAPTTTAATIRQGVTPGAYCKPAGALGRTSTGKLMMCKRSATDDRLRWRAA